jgi:hypothetical protein
MGAAKPFARTMATTLEEKQQQLSEVRQAISAVLLRGQAYILMDGNMQRQVTRANLKQLQERERQLEVEVARMERGGIGVNYGMPM